MVKKEDTVTLISAEGFEFIIDRKAALVSNTLKNMLTSAGSFTETELGEVRFPEISTHILEKWKGDGISYRTRDHTGAYDGSKLLTYLKDGLCCCKLKLPLYIKLYFNCK